MAGRSSRLSPMPTTTIRYRLGTTTRRAVLITHIATAGAWLGIDVTMAVLVGVAVTTAEAATLAFVLQALELVTIWPLLVAGVLCLLSGIVLGLGSRWGLVRYWWVAIKLGLNLLLTTLVLIALAPGVQELAAQARSLPAAELLQVDLTNMIFPPIVSTTSLLFAMTLSVAKPWGRTDQRRRRAAAELA